MAKRKNRRQRTRKEAGGFFTPGSPSLPRRLVEGLERAGQLVRKKRWTEAREELESLDRRYPGQPMILTDLVI